MLKYRILCVALSVVFLVCLGIGLYVPESPNISLLYVFGCLCIAGLLGNAVLSVVEMRRQEQKFRQMTGGDKS